MGKATATFRELRFLIGDELPEVYVLIEAGGDAPLGVQGWHHKTFPPSRSIDQILGAMVTTDDCVLWPLEAPPERRA